MTVRAKDTLTCVISNIMAGFLIVLLAAINMLALCGFNWWQAMLDQAVWVFVLAVVWHAFSISAAIYVLITGNLIITVDENGVSEKFLNRTLYHISWQDVRRLEIVSIHRRSPRLIINVMSIDKESFISKYNMYLESSKRRISFLYRKDVLTEIKKYCNKWIYGWENTLEYVEEGLGRT